MVEYVVAGTFLFNLFLVFIGLFITCKKVLRYRLEFVMSDSCCNIYRVFFWFMEILYIPLIFNVSWPANCKFYSERDAVDFTDCTEDGTLYFWGLKGIMFGCYVLAILYNMQLYCYIRQNKISSTFHIDAIQKKEVEYSYGINKQWSSQKFFTFSSYRNGMSSIYHRIVFNVYCMFFIGVNAL